MAIAKKPSPPIADTNDKKASDFIDAAEKQKKEAGIKNIPVLIRLAPGVLDKIDECAKKRGVSRSAFISFLVGRGIDQGEG